MRRINTSDLSLVLSATALFVALGGTALAVSQIGTSQIKDGAVTNHKLASGSVGTRKIADGAVTNSKLGNNAVTNSKLGNTTVTSSKLGDNAVRTSKLANNAVTTGKLGDNAVNSAKVADGSLTASDVGPNTFLAAGGTAADASKLGGVPPSSYLTGTGRMVFNRISVPAGQTQQLLEVGFGHIDGFCDTGSVAKLRFVSEFATLSVVDWATNFGAPGTVEIHSANAVTAGTFLEQLHPAAGPQSVTWEASYNDGSANHVATAWTSGQPIGGSCLFIGQSVTSG